MAEIVNLRMARKARDRSKKAGQAAENRAKFGQSKAERKARGHEQARDAAMLDNAKRERD